MKSINGRVIMVVNHLKCILRLADMEERRGVLIQNEKHANKSVTNHKPILGFVRRKNINDRNISEWNRKYEALR